MFAREIIGLINSHVKGEKVEIGRIDLMKHFSVVEVVEKDADRVIKGLKHGVTVKGRPVVADRTQGGDSHPTSPKGGEKSSSKKKGNNPWKKEKSSRSEEKKGTKPSREERGYSAPRGKKFKKEDWMKFLHPEEGKRKKKGELKGDMPDFSEEGWAKRED